MNERIDYIHIYIIHPFIHSVSHPFPSIWCENHIECTVTYKRSQDTQTHTSTCVHTYIYRVRQKNVYTL